MRRYAQSAWISVSVMSRVSCTGMNGSRATPEGSTPWRSARKKSASVHWPIPTGVRLEAALKDAGVPQAVVQELIGHDSKAMSALYTHVGQEALQKATAALPEL